MDEERPIRIGVSACLLGDRVRWDGNHRLDPYLVETLGRYFEYVPVCPEVEAGFGTPREPFRLIGDPRAPTLVTVKGKVDHTERMLTWARSRVEALADDDLCGFILMKASPSSGMERVKVYDHSGMPRKAGVGLFARTLMERFPLLPVEESGRLHDPGLRENFIERVFALRSWRDARGRASGPRWLATLVDFHTRHKLLLMSHSTELYRATGRLVADAKTIGRDRVLDQYESAFMEALRLRATKAKHVNVVQHVLGYFKKDLSADEKQELLGLIESYRAGAVPLIVPLTLLSHYARKYEQTYLLEQVYLHPHPLELGLRNHA